MKPIAHQRNVQLLLRCLRWRQEHVAEFIELLDSGMPLDLEIPRRGPLLIASIESRLPLEVVRELLKRGASPDISVPPSMYEDGRVYGETALARAATQSVNRNSYEICVLLVEAGATIDLQDTRGRTALGCLLPYIADTRQYTSWDEAFPPEQVRDWSWLIKRDFEHYFKTIRLLVDRSEIKWGECYAGERKGLYELVAFWQQWSKSTRLPHKRSSS